MRLSLLANRASNHWEVDICSRCIRSVRFWGCHSASRSAQSFVFLGVFVGEDEVTGTQAVSEGVEAHGGLGLGSVGTGRVLCVLPVGFLLFIGNYHVDFPLLGLGTECPYPIQG